MRRANFLARHNERPKNPAKIERIEPPPPCRITWEVRVFPFLLLLIEGQRARIARLEEFDQQQAVELDRLRSAEEGATTC